MLKSAKTFMCVPIKDEDGRIDIDVTEIYNINDPGERYPTAPHQWRLGTFLISEEEVYLDENKVAYNKRKMYL